MTELSISVPGEPVSKARPRVTKTHTYTPTRSKAWERACAVWAGKAMLEHNLGMLSGPLGLRVTALFAVPQSWPQWKRNAALDGRIRHTARPDADNILKACKDALNGVVWHDDSYVVQTSIAKDYSENPRVEILVYSIEAMACQINSKREFLAA